VSHSERHLNPFLFVLSLPLLVLLIATPASAEWPSNPAENLAIADRPSEQVIPKTASTPDDGLYVGWFDLAAGNYDVYLQLLDDRGDEQWAHNGILVSNHPQNSWLVDWDLIADSQGNCVLTFVDARYGGDWDVLAYKVSPTGEMLWGDDGISLSFNDDFEANPRVTEASDGDFVFVWSRSPDAGDGKIMMQRLAPDGTLRFAAGSLPVAGEPGEDPGFASVVAAADGAVIVSWLRDISTSMSDRHLRARKFSSLGDPLWISPVEVYNATSVPMGYNPKLYSDGDGGALLLWHSSPIGSLFIVLVQHLDGAGTELFPHNGQSASGVTNRHHIDPCLAHDQSTGEIYLFWNERNSSQGLRGIYGQKLDAAGNLQWGGGGRELRPVDDVIEDYPRCVAAEGGAMVFFTASPASMPINEQLFGARVDSDGAFVWPGEFIDVSVVVSSKARLPLVVDGGGEAKIVWEDDRNGSVDLFGQNINPDGSLGVNITGVGATPTARGAHLQPNWPNPFNPRTTIAFSVERTEHVILSVFDLSGRLVSVLADRIYPPGNHSLAWHGLDQGGQAVSSGTYFYRLEAGEFTETHSMTLVR
jgi:hypothetical protein